MSKKQKRFWVLSASRQVEHATSPCLPEDAIVVVEQGFALVEATFDEVEEWIRHFPYWRNAGPPRAGKWIGEGGEAVYIDDDCEIVESAADVLRSLGQEITDCEDLCGDDILADMRRVF